MNLVVNFKITVSGASLLGFESLLYHLLAVLPWESHLTSFIPFPFPHPYNRG